MTGQLRHRYQMFRRLEIPAKLALEFARESLVEFPSSLKFICALQELERMLKIHFGYGVSLQQMRDEFGYNVRIDE